MLMCVQTASARAGGIGHPASHRHSITPTAPGEARELVRLHAPAALVEAGELAASELATNALKHADGADRFTLTVTATALILTVTDSRPDRLVPRPDPLAAFDLETESGRGLAIIAAMGARLLVRRDADRKRVTVRFPIGETS